MFRADDGLHKGSESKKCVTTTSAGKTAVGVGVGGEGRVRDIDELMHCVALVGLHGTLRGQTCLWGPSPGRSWPFLNRPDGY